MYHCLVYNASGVPIDKISIYRALVQVLFRKTAYPIEYWDEEEVVIRTVKERYLAPKKIAIKQYVSLPDDWFAPAPVNMRRLEARDKSTCQYCGRKKGNLRKGEFWTKDHIVPQDQGGGSDWMNMVLACSTCNNKKRNRTPKEAGMSLINMPHVPFKWELELERLKH